MTSLLYGQMMLTLGLTAVIFTGFSNQGHCSSSSFIIELCTCTMYMQNMAIIMGAKQCEYSGQCVLNRLLSSNRKSTLFGSAG